MSQDGLTLNHTGGMPQDRAVAVLSQHLDKLSYMPGLKCLRVTLSGHNKSIPEDLAKALFSVGAENFGVPQNLTPPYKDGEEPRKTTIVDVRVALPALRKLADAVELKDREKIPKV